MKYETKKIYLSLSLLIGILSISFCSSVTAWTNGPIEYTSNLRPESQYKACAAWAQDLDPYEEAVSCYKRFYTNGDSSWYSTHDYIAHFALDYLVESDPSGRYYWLRDPNQRYFFTYLLATEYPDYDTCIFPELSLDNGRSLITSSDMMRTHTYTGLLTLSAARDASINAVKYLNSPNYRWEATAFYLGLIAHYIGDLALAPHILRPYDGSFDSCLSHDASKVTTLEDYNLNSNNRFFTIDLFDKIGYTPDKLYILDLFKFLENEKHSEIVYFISEMMTFTTLLNLEVDFNLEESNGMWSTQNLYNFFIEKNNFRFHEVERNDEEFQPYFDRIEDLLNWGVYWTAAALKICLDQWDGKKSPDDDSSNPRPDPPEREPPWDTADYLVRFGAMIAAITALGILNRKLLGDFLGRF